MKSKLYDILAVLKKATHDLEKLIYEEYHSEEKYFTTPDKIINMVNLEFACDCTENTKRKSISESRHAAVYLLSKYTRLSHRERAMSVGCSNHTTSIHSIRKANDLMSVDEYYRHKINNIEKNLDKLLKRD
jgi:chromosomal replication initiation ATPase DnaA